MIGCDVNSQLIGVAYRDVSGSLTVEGGILGRHGVLGLWSLPR